jgi:hypothetical protein
MNYLRDVRYDGTGYHVTFWNSQLKKRVFVGRFKEKMLADSARRQAVIEANKSHC